MLIYIFFPPHSILILSNVDIVSAMSCIISVKMNNIFKEILELRAY